MLGEDLLVPTPGRPLVFASEALFARWQRRIPASHRSLLDFMGGITRTTRITAVRIGELPAVALASDGAPTRFFPAEGGGVLVRVFAGDKEALRRADPARVKKWKAEPNEYDFAGDAHALFCDGSAALRVSLADGAYAVGHARSKAGSTTLEMWRFTRARDRRRAPVDTTSPVQLADADADAAEAMVWAQMDEGPMVVIPREMSPAWPGGPVKSGDQPVLATAKGVEALVLPKKGPVAFWSTGKGGLLMAGEEGLNDDSVAAALSIPEDRFHALPIAFPVGPSGVLSLFDGAQSGTDADGTEVSLAPGRYGVSFAGPFRTPGAALAYAVRLHPLAMGAPPPDPLAPG